MAVTLSIDRTTTVKGPCFLTFNSQTIYSKDDVRIMPQKETWDVPTSVAGKKSGKNLKDITFKVMRTQDGEVTAGLLGVIALYASQIPGTSIFGAGLPLNIVSLTESSDNFITFRNAAPTKLPEMTFATDKTAFGALEFTCIGANGVAVNDANRFAYINTKVLSGTITGATNASPAVITSNAHGLANGDPISISGVVGNTAVNVNGYAQAVTANTFEVSSDAAGQTLIAGNGAYTSGGVWGYGWPLNLANVIATPFTGQWATTVPTGTITSSEASPDVVTSSTAHGLAVGDRVIISGMSGDTAINGTWYVVSVPTTTTFEVSATRGGSALAGAGSAGTGGTFLRANALDLFDTEEGMQVTFDLGLTMKRSNNLGTYDILFSSLEVKAKGLPISGNSGPSTRDIISSLNVQGTSVQMGQSLSAEGQDLILSGNGIYFRLYQAAVESNEAVYSTEKLRPGDFGWTAIRRFGSGANLLKPLYAVSTSPINS
jgi:hypothetical protein